MDVGIYENSNDIHLFLCRDLVFMLIWTQGFMEIVMRYIYLKHVQTWCLLFIFEVHELFPHFIFVPEFNFILNVECWGWLIGFDFEGVPVFLGVPCSWVMKIHFYISVFFQ